MHFRGRDIKVHSLFFFLYYLMEILLMSQTRPVVHANNGAPHQPAPVAVGVPRYYHQPAPVLFQPYPHPRPFYVQPDPEPTLICCNIL